MNKKNYFKLALLSFVFCFKATIQTMYSTIVTATAISGVALITAQNPNATPGQVIFNSTAAGVAILSAKHLESKNPMYANGIHTGTAMTVISATYVQTKNESQGYGCSIQ